jgi:hypothetical protein
MVPVPVLVVNRVPVPTGIAFLFFFLQEQMEEDLGLFLNENTLAFTSWLHTVLEKLR